jgi:glycosyltransferase involved in cell wall biosynthesis
LRKNKANILVIELDILNSEISGVGQTVLNLSKSWLDDGNNVILVLPQNWSDFLLLRKVLAKAELKEVMVLPANKSIINVAFLYAVRLLQSFNHIFRMIHSKDLDFIFVDGQMSLFAAFIAKKFSSLVYKKTPVVIMPFYHFALQDDPSQKKLVTFLQQLSTLLSLTFANKFLSAYFFTESTFTAKLLNKYYFIPRERIFDIGGGIDDAFVEKTKQFHTSQKLFDACFVGRIHQTKGVLDLVRAWAKVRSKIPDAKLAIVGGGYPDYRKMIEATIRELHLEDNITMCGYVSEEDKFKILMQSKLLVHPAYEEGIPLTFFEAASLNVPIVTYYLPTYESVIDCLIPVKKGDIESLASTLVNCISKYGVDGKAFFSLMEKEEELVKKHTWKYIAKSLISER